MTERFLTRKLSSTVAGELRVLEALCWPTLFGTGLRVYLGTGSSFDVQGDGLKVSAIKKIGSNAIISAEGSSPQSDIVFTVANGSAPIALSSPETELFDDLDVLLAQRHHETPEQVVQWLLFHIEHHRATGLLLIDRAPADEGFAAALGPMIEDLAIERAVIVNSDIPLGADGQAALYDSATAPRAKSRKTKADAWRAPLAEPTLYDIMRWRFLARAGAVIALDPVDYLDLPDDGIPAFTAVRQAHSGVMPVIGRGLYPWRVRKGADATWHDHICHADPTVKTATKWSIAAKRLGSSVIWMPNSIVGAQPVVDETLSYRKAMSLAFQYSDVAELVNKDLLVLDESRLKSSLSAGAKPIQPPAKPKAGPRILVAPPTGRTVVVTCMKNEGPFILEWIAYHKMIGVDDFLVYTNDCDDGTVELLDQLSARGIVERRDNPFRETGGKPQQSALDAARDEELVKNAGWIISMDVDEFINVHIGGNRLPDLYAAIGEASLVSMTWRLFGNNDIAEFEDRPITEQFTRCAPRIIRRPHQAWGFKTLFRNQGLFKGIGVHRPRGFLGGEAVWVNGSGNPMPDRLFKTGWRSDMSTVGYDLVTLNHYSMRSAESFLVKRDRGRVNHVARDQGEGYWFRMNNNDEQDLSIQVHAQSLKTALNKLLDDPDLNAAHQNCVAAHQAKITKLRASSEFAEFFNSITGERMRKLSRLHRHFGMNVFLSGPSVVPDKVFDPNLPSDYFFNVPPPEGRAAE